MVIFFKLNDLCPWYSAYLFTLTLSRPVSQVKVTVRGHVRKDVAKLFGVCVWWLNRVSLSGWARLVCRHVDLVVQPRPTRAHLMLNVSDVDTPASLDWVLACSRLRTMYQISCRPFSWCWAHTLMTHNPFRWTLNVFQCYRGHQKQQWFKTVKSGYISSLDGGIVVKKRSTSFRLSLLLMLSPDVAVVQNG